MTRFVPVSSGPSTKRERERGALSIAPTYPGLLSEQELLDNMSGSDFVSGPRLPPRKFHLGLIRPARRRRESTDGSVKLLRPHHGAGAPVAAFADCLGGAGHVGEGPPPQGQRKAQT